MLNFVKTELANVAENATLLHPVMASKVYSAAVVGVDAIEIEVEVHAGYGEEGRVTVVGLPDTAVRESKDRVLSAITNSALRWPRGKITVNLAPATVRKEGPSFDLPIAIGMSKSAMRIGFLISVLIV